VKMTAKHRAAVEALKAWAIEANQNDPAARGDLRKNSTERAEKPRTKAERRAFAILCMHDI
jgi:hypothetical protein